MYEPVAPAQLAGLTVPVIAVGVDAAIIDVVWVNKQPLLSFTVIEYVPGVKPVVGDVAEKAPLLIA